MSTIPPVIKFSQCLLKCSFSTKRATRRKKGCSLKEDNAFLIEKNRSRRILKQCVTVLSTVQIETLLKVHHIVISQKT
jgi:hypothetical protein